MFLAYCDVIDLEGTWNIRSPLSNSDTDIFDF